MAAALAARHVLPTNTNQQVATSTALRATAMQVAVEVPQQALVLQVTAGLRYLLVAIRRVTRMVWQVVIIAVES
jgi:hypothetical protein